MIGRIAYEGVADLLISKTDGRHDQDSHGFEHLELLGMATRVRAEFRFGQPGLLARRKSLS
jgi:hypothetical protein